MDCVSSTEQTYRCHPRIKTPSTLESTVTCCNPEWERCFIPSRRRSPNCSPLRLFHTRGFHPKPFFSSLPVSTRTNEGGTLERLTVTRNPSSPRKGDPLQPVSSPPRDYVSPPTPYGRLSFRRVKIRGTPKGRSQTGVLGRGQVHRVRKVRFYYRVHRNHRCDGSDARFRREDLSSPISRDPSHKSPGPRTGNLSREKGRSSQDPETRDEAETGMGVYPGVLSKFPRDSK